MSLRSFNNPIAAFIDYLSRTGTDASTEALFGIQGITATGGTINDYTVGEISYRSHTFLDPGSFDISSLGSFSADASFEVLMVAWRWRWWWRAISRRWWWRRRSFRRFY
jgi:hypothetical protein